MVRGRGIISASFDKEKSNAVRLGSERHEDNG